MVNGGFLWIYKFEMVRMGVGLNIYSRMIDKQVDMKQIQDVGTGEVKVASGSGVLRALAIGSCIAVAAYDQKRKIGAMAHIMLPGRSPEKFQERTKYAADAIAEMLAQITAAGSSKNDIEVCMVGGGNVLKKEDDTICTSNIKSVTELLTEQDIPIRGKIVGGMERKGIFLDIEKGAVSYTEGDGSKRLLWKPGSTELQ